MNDGFNKLLSNYSKAQIALLITALTTLSILAKTGKVFSPESGICYNWQKEIDKIEYCSEHLDAYGLVSYGGMTWKEQAEGGHYTCCPIHDGEKFRTKWEGTQLKLRLSLIKHLLGGLKAYQRTLA